MKSLVAWCVAGLAAGWVHVAAALPSTPVNPAVVYSLGGKQDQSINQNVARGISRFRFAGMVDSAEFEPADESQFEPALRKFAAEHRQPIIVVGALQIPALTRVAREFPTVDFTLLDAELDLPNVRSVTFKEQEAAFLVGIAAAMASKTGKLGFVGGMDSPPIRRFQCGYEQGAKYANPKAEVIAAMIGTTPQAFAEPQKGAEIARGQFEHGVDVVFAAAGASGVGVLQEAKDRGKLAIGGTNQARLFPGTVLTTMAKHFDAAVFETLAVAAAGRWKAGHAPVGLADGAVGWTLDENNQALVPPAMKAKVEAAQQQIVDGKIVVHDDPTGKTCR